MMIQGKTEDLEITEDILSGLKVSYPQVDVADELAKMHWWLVKNPARIPVTPARFITNWLKKTRPKSEARLHLVGSKMTESEMLAAGQRIGVAPAVGETWQQFARRLQERMARQA